MSPRSSVAFCAIDGVLLIAHGKHPPDDAAWDQLVSKSIELYKVYQFGRMIATSDGGAPTASQRHRLDLRIREEIAKTGSPRGRIAILSQSPFVRAVVGASILLENNWFRWARKSENVARMYRAFTPAELPLAIAWLDVPNEMHARIASTLQDLRQQVSNG